MIRYYLRRLWWWRRPDYRFLFFNSTVLDHLFAGTDSPLWDTEDWCYSYNARRLFLYGEGECD